MLVSITGNILKGINNILGSAQVWEIIGQVLAVVGLIFALVFVLAVCAAIVSAVWEKIG